MPCPCCSIRVTYVSHPYTVIKRPLALYRNVTRQEMQKAAGRVGTNNVPTLPKSIGKSAGNEDQA